MQNQRIAMKIVQKKVKAKLEEKMMDFTRLFLEKKNSIFLNTCNESVRIIFNVHGVFYGIINDIIYVQ